MKKDFCIVKNLLVRGKYNYIQSEFICIQKILISIWIFSRKQLFLHSRSTNFFNDFC